jgi:hypothetical protein
MKRNFTFKTNYDVVETRRIVLDYFDDQNFMLTYQDADMLVFNKGSRWENMTTYNPLEWKSTIKVIFKDKTCDLHAIISTFGQIVTPNEEALWDTFFENLRSSTADNSSDYAEINEAMAHKTMEDGQIYASLFVLALFLVGAPFIYLGIRFNMMWLAIGLAIEVAIILTKYKAKRDIRKSE